MVDTTLFNIIFASAISDVLLLNSSTSICGPICYSESCNQLHFCPIAPGRLQVALALFHTVLIAHLEIVRLRYRYSFTCKIEGMPSKTKVSYNSRVGGGLCVAVAPQ